MTQHLLPVTFQARPAMILIGWDRPCQGFFLVIKPEGGLEEIAYSSRDDLNLSSSAGLPSSLDYYLEILRLQGIALTDELLERLQADKANDRQSGVFWYDKEGSLVKSSEPVLIRHDVASEL